MLVDTAPPFVLPSVEKGYLISFRRLRIKHGSGRLSLPRALGDGPRGWKRPTQLSILQEEW